MVIGRISVRERAWRRAWLASADGGAEDRVGSARSLAAVLAVLALAACSGGGSDEAASSTTTTARPRPRRTGDHRRRRLGPVPGVPGLDHRRSRRPGRPHPAFLIDATAGAQGCLDVVTLTFQTRGDGTPPGYIVGYRDRTKEPFIDGDPPSEIDVPGNAHLVVNVAPGREHRPDDEDNPRPTPATSRSTTASTTTW